MKLKFKLIAAVLSVTVATGPANALGKVSRACSFGAIPSPLKGVALIFFELLGMPPSLKDLNNASQTEQEDHWILESITTDYGSLRYYLFAENRVYRVHNPWSNSQQYWDVTGRYFQEATYKSAWVAQSLDPRIVADPRLAIFKFNRRVMFSARAGHPDIVQAYPRLNPNGPDLFMVYGQHYYYDPLGKTQGYLGSTKADGCNLLDWGLEDR